MIGEKIPTTALVVCVIIWEADTMSVVEAGPVTSCTISPWGVRQGSIRPATGAVNAKGRGRKTVPTRSWRIFVSAVAAGFELHVEHRAGLCRGPRPLCHS